MEFHIVPNILIQKHLNNQIMELHNLPNILIHDLRGRWHIHSK